MKRHLEMIENLRLELRARGLETDARIQRHLAETLALGLSR